MIPRFLWLDAIASPFLFRSPTYEPLISLYIDGLKNDLGLLSVTSP